MGCTSCPLLAACGGLTARGGGWNCLEACKGCDRATCDVVCMSKPTFGRRLLEVRNDLGAKHVGSLQGPPSGEMPKYVPVLQYALPSDARLPVGPIAIPLASLMRFDRRRGSYGPIARTPDELRQRFGVTPNTPVFILGTGQDAPIERYWHLRREGAADALSKLNVTVIAPNYSVFLDDPRTQHLYNRRRSLMCAEELGARGVRVIPYLHGITGSDYAFWADFLREHEEITTMAKEFQTGALTNEIAEQVLNRMKMIEDRVGRRIHLVAIGAHRLAKRIAARFDHWTVMDSSAFMKAVHRRIAIRHGTNIEWEFVRDEDVADLFFNNIRRVRDGLDLVAAETPSRAR